MSIDELCRNCHKRPIDKPRSTYCCSVCFDKKKAYKQTEKYKRGAAERHLRNKEKLNSRSREWQKNNPDRRRKNVSAWISKNPGKPNEYTKAYQSKHPEQVTKSSRKRREQFKEIVGTFTLEEWVTLCERFNNACLWCGEIGIKLTIDHVVPVVRKGTNYISNIQPLCGSCNAKKGKKIIDFRPFGTAILDWT
jgi:hypothetical protein